MSRKSIFFVSGIIAFGMLVFLSSAYFWMFGEKRLSYASGIVTAMTLDGFIIADGRGNTQAIVTPPGTPMLRGTSSVDAVVPGNHVIITGLRMEQGPFQAHAVRIIDTHIPRVPRNP